MKKMTRTLMIHTCITFVLRFQMNGTEILCKVFQKMISISIFCLGVNLSEFDPSLNFGELCFGLYLTYLTLSLIPPSYPAMNKWNKCHRDEQVLMMVHRFRDSVSRGG